MDEHLLAARGRQPRSGDSTARRRVALVSTFAVALLAALLPAVTSTTPVGAAEASFELLPADFFAEHIGPSGVVAGTYNRQVSLWDGGDDVTTLGGPGDRTTFDGVERIGGRRTTDSAPMIWSPAGATELTQPVDSDGTTRNASVIGVASDGSVIGTTGWRSSDRANGVRWASPGAAPELITSLSTIFAMFPDGRTFGMLDSSTAKWAIDDGGTVTPVSGFGRYVSVADTSSAGHIVGYDFDTGATVLWKDGTKQVVSGIRTASAVNAHGYVAGYRGSDSALALRDDEGSVTPIIDLLPAGHGFSRILTVEDMNDDCQILARGERKELVDGRNVSSYPYFRLSLPTCGPSLSVSVVDSPGLTGSVKVGAEFDITARISNDTDESVSALALAGDNGLFGPEGLSIVNGPIWSGQESLAPGESVDVSWTLTSDSVGITQVEVRVSGFLRGATAEATAGSSVQIAPPIDIKVDSGQTASMVLGDEFDVAVTVTNEWDKPVDGVKPDGLNGPSFSSIRVIDGPSGPGGAAVPNGGYTLAPGQSVRLDYRVRLDEQVYPAELTSLINGRDPDSGAIFFLSGSSGSPDELVVEVEGLEPSGDVFDVEVTVRNTGDEPLDEVGFIDDSGLAYNPDVYEPEERGDLELITGATPPLPETLDPGQEFTTTFTATAKEGGGVLLVSRVRGDLPDDNTLRAQDSVEVIIDACERTAEAMKACVIDLLSQQMELLNAQAVAGSLNFEDSLASQYPEGVVLPPDVTQRAMEPYVPTLGEAAKSLIPRSSEEAWEIARRGIPGYYSQRMIATTEVLKGTVTAAYGLANGYVQNFVWVTPEVRDANIERVVDFALTEGGYQAEGLGSYLSVIEKAYDGDFDEASRQYIELLEQNERITGDLILSAEGYVDSQITKFNNWKILATTDRVEASVQLLETKGNIEGTVQGIVIESWLGARATQALEGAGLLKASGLGDEAVDLAKAVETPPKPKRPKGDGPDGPELDEPDVPTSPKSLDRPDRLEDLPPGDVDSDMLSKLLNGHPPEVQAEFDRIIRELNDELGVDVQIQARSAEVEGIQKVMDGKALAKEQWNKAKSISFIDTTYLGVPSELTGGAAFYRPKPDWAKINAVPREDPLRGLIEARIETQNGLWKKWSGETLDVNGNVVKVDSAPSGMRRDFEQMLSDDGFEFSNSLRGQPQRELDGSLVRDPAGNIVHDADIPVQARNVKLDMQEVDLGDGRTAFVPLDRATGLPYGADVDIFAVLDASKVPPTGFTGSMRSQIELRLQDKLRKSKIPFGEHGWTHSGFDLTDELSAVRVQELFRVRPPAEAAAAVKSFPESFGVSPDLNGEELALAIKKMQEKVSAGEYVITYGRDKKSIGYGALPNVTLR